MNPLIKEMVTELLDMAEKSSESVSVDPFDRNAVHMRNAGRFTLDALRLLVHGLEEVPDEQPDAV